MVLPFLLIYNDNLIFVGLRKKNFSPGSGGDEVTRGNNVGPGSIELFGNTDVIVKHVLEVHIFGVTVINFMFAALADFSKMCFTNNFHQEK